MATVKDKRRANAAKARAAKVKNPPQRMRGAAVEPIRPEVMYTFTQCSEWFGIGRVKLRQLETAGMKCGVASGQKWVRGSDLQEAILGARHG